MRTIELRVRIEVDLYSKTCDLTLGPNAKRMFEQWKATGADEDFETLTEYIADAVADRIDYEIVDIRKVG